MFLSNQVDLLARQLDLNRSCIRRITLGQTQSSIIPSVPAPHPAMLRSWGDPTEGIGAHFLGRWGLPHIRFRLATDAYGVSKLVIPPNVECLGRIGHLAYRELLQKAEFVVSPTPDLKYPAGASVLSEGFACGRPAVVTRTAALAEYARPEAAALYGLGDGESLKEEIETLHADADRRVSMGLEARKLAIELFDSRSMWSQVAALIGEALA